MVFTTEVFLEVATESWPEWHWNSRPLNYVQIFNRLSYHAMSWTSTQSSPISYFVQCSDFIRPLPSSFATFTTIEVSHK